MPKTTKDAATPLPELKSAIKNLFGRAVLRRRPQIGRSRLGTDKKGVASCARFALPATVAILLALCVTASAQIQQAWVAKYNNGIPNGNHQALKMTLDASGNIYALGISQNANTNTGYAVVKYAPNGNQLWAARYDSTNFPSATPTGFALDSSNNVVVTGSAVTVKFDAHGSLLWTEPYSGTAIAIDSGQNVYITGVSGNFTTSKLNPAGSNLWSQTWVYQGLQNMSQAIVVDSSNNVYVAGMETVSIPPENSQIVGLLKYDGNGSQLWENDVGPGAVVHRPQVVGFALDGFNNICLEFNFLIGVGDVNGYQTYKYNSGGTATLYAGDPTDDGASLAHGLAIDNFGNIIVTGGNDYNYPNNLYGTYKLDTNGNYLWTNLYPNTMVGNSIATSIAVDTANSVYVTGYSPSLGTNATSDIMTLKYGINGNQIWGQRYHEPGNGNDAGNAIAVDNLGNVYVAGYETETNGFTSMILIKYSPVTIRKQSNGNVILHAYGSPGESFDFQASTNLQTWQDLGIISADTNGLAQFATPTPPSSPPASITQSRSEASSLR